jgi:hypothetical protein
VPALLAAQQVQAPRPPHLFLRVGGAAITANGVGDIRPALHVAGGVLLAGRVGLLAQFVHHTADFSPRQVGFRPARSFLLAGVEWSPHVAPVEQPGDLDAALRLNGGVAFREFLDPGTVLGLGLAARVALAPFLAAVLDIQGLLTWAADDPFPRCPANGYDPDCHPLASSGPIRADGWAALLLEVRW